MTERSEAAQLTDDELMARCVETGERLRRAQEDRDLALVDAMIRGLNQTQIAEAAGLARRSLFKISDREWTRRQAERLDQ